MNLSPTSGAELQTTLLALARDPLSTDESRAEHYRSCMALLLHLSKHDELSAEMSEASWHFLSDADIRLSEPDYHSNQVTAVLVSAGVAS